MVEITPAIVRNLESIPTELAHQIIDDLRIWDILKLLSYDSDRVDDCIMSHPICNKIFNKGHPVNLPWVKFAAKFYGEFLVQVNKPFIDGMMSYNLYQFHQYFTLYSTVKMMYRRLYKEIKYHWDMVDLTQYGASRSFTDIQPLPDYPDFKELVDFHKLKEVWNEIQAAKAVLFEQRASELRWAARMLEDNPDILKRTLDPEQVRRPNTGHTVSRMRRNAKNIETAHRAKFIGSEHFRYVFSAIIPFDSTLNELVHLMQSRGLVVGNQVAQDGFPSSVLQLVNIVVRGMQQFNLTPAKPGELADWKCILRTGNTPWSEEMNIYIDGCFFTPFKALCVSDFQQPLSCRWYPHVDSEKEWLESFVGLYRHLKGLEK